MQKNSEEQTLYDVTIIGMAMRCPGVSDIKLLVSPLLCVLVLSTEYHCPLSQTPKNTSRGVGG